MLPVEEHLRNRMSLVTSWCGHFPYYCLFTWGIHQERDRNVQLWWCHCLKVILSKQSNESKFFSAKLMLCEFCISKLGIAYHDGGSYSYLSYFIGGLIINHILFLFTYNSIQGYCMPLQILNPIPNPQNTSFMFARSCKQRKPGIIFTVSH